MAAPVANDLTVQAPLSIWSIGEKIQTSIEAGKARFEDLTRKVFKNETAARIAQNVVYGAPYSIATFALMALPAYVAMTTIASFAAVHLVRTLAHARDGMVFSSNTYKNLFNGIGMTYLWKGIQETARLATQTQARPMAIIVNMVVAGLAINVAPRYFQSSTTAA